MELNGAQDGATSLEPEELADLKPGHISTREQLNAWEQANIQQARDWLFRPRQLKPVRLLSDSLLRELHRRMFDETWRWAGQYRVTAKNIGIEAHAIATAVRELCDDAQYWLEHRAFGVDESAVRFHHRLVLIHPFANGNGRHARLMTDALLASLDHEPFSWGSANLQWQESIRDRYLAVLRAADTGDIAPLLEFARS